LEDEELLDDESLFFDSLFDLSLLLLASLEALLSAAACFLYESLR